MTDQPTDQQEQPFGEWQRLAQLRDESSADLAERPQNFMGLAFADRRRALREIELLLVQNGRLVFERNALQAESASLKARCMEIYDQWTRAHWNSMSEEHKKDALEWGSKEARKIIDGGKVR